MFLTTILEHKYSEVAYRKELYPLDYKLAEQLPKPRPFTESLAKGKAEIALIAEVKKASPSKGLLCQDFDPVSLARGYELAGAAAISVLTDQRFFQGSLEYLSQIKLETKATPILRKDFIIDKYQLLEARLSGADAVLLIVAALGRRALNSLISEAKSLGLCPLVEVHDQSELEIALASEAVVIGINNRNLKTFEVRLETTLELLQSIPAGRIVVSESGIRNRSDIKKLSQAGVNAVLIGEAIVTANDPQMKIRELMRDA